MTYVLNILPGAQADIDHWQRTGRKATLRKLAQLLEELTEHPRTGTGKPEQLHGDRVGQWSRRIDKKHRLIDTIKEQIVLVEVLAARGHYD